MRNAEFSIKFRNMRGAHGLAHIGDDLIELNPKGELIPTVVHEVLHHLHPDWSETKVLEYESKIMQLLSSRQMVRILLELSKAIEA